MLTTLKETARILGRNYNTLHIHAQLGHFPARRAGATWLVIPSEVQEAMDIMRVQKRVRRRKEGVS